MRVMSWNVWWRFGDDWRRRERGILSTLEALRPDIAGPQEVWATADATQADLLADELGMYSAFGAPSLPPPRPPESPDHAGVEVGVAVLSRWPILNVQQHPLPSRHRPEVVALAVVVDHPDGRLHMVTSGLDWELEFAGQRAAQTRALAALLTHPSRDGPLPVLLTGDLNAPPNTPEIQVLTAVMVDAWVAARGIRPLRRGGRLPALSRWPAAGTGRCARPG
jgi:endonuclease/exonuclease/phosphatase family metal-dependent hydrolase